MTWNIRPDGKFDTGRPTVMTKEVIDKLQQAFSIGCSDSEACAYANICQDALYKYQERNPEFTEWKHQLKQNPVLKAKNTVVKNLNDPKIALEYLKAKCKDEFGIRTEITGANGQPIIPPIINIQPIKVKNE